MPSDASARPVIRPQQDQVTRVLVLIQVFLYFICLFVVFCDLLLLNVFPNFYSLLLEKYVCPIFRWINFLFSENTFVC